MFQDGTFVGKYKNWHKKRADFFIVGKLFVSKVESGLPGIRARTSERKSFLVGTMFPPVGLSSKELREESPTFRKKSFNKKRDFLVSNSRENGQRVDWSGQQSPPTVKRREPPTPKRKKRENEPPRFLL